MDRKAKTLDIRYQKIHDTEKKLLLCREILRTLTEADVESDVVSDRVAEQEQKLKDLTAEYERQLEERLEDFMLVEDGTCLRILKMWYMDGLSWAEIAGQFHKSEVWAMNIRDKGLSQIALKKRITNFSPFPQILVEDH